MGLPLHICQVSASCGSKTKKEVNGAGVCKRRVSSGLGARGREQVAILEDAISHVTAHDAFDKLAIL